MERKDGRSDNCIICAEEFPLSELHGIALSTINITRFKICSSCLKKTDPMDDYREVKNIINSFFKIEG